MRTALPVTHQYSVPVFVSWNILESAHQDSRICTVCFKILVFSIERELMLFILTAERNARVQQ